MQKNVKYVTVMESQTTLRVTAGWYLLQATEPRSNSTSLRYSTAQEDITATPMEGRKQTWEKVIQESRLKKYVDTMGIVVIRKWVVVKSVGVRR